jgi:Cu(I)/Ag(I) efflux system membrane fusion protein
MKRCAVILLSALVLGACDRAAPPVHEHSGPSEHAAAESAPHEALYQCPMHPQIVRTEPGTCPICGMTLQLVENLDRSASAVAGHAPFVLSAERQQLIGVTRAPVEVRNLTRDIRSTATVANDPGLYAALVEYREAVRSRGLLRATSLHEAATGSDALVRAAALKLRRLGFGERDVAALADLDPTTFILPGPKVWIYAQLFEDDAPLVKPGMPVEVEIPSQPGRSVSSTVFAVDPVVAPESRTVRVRALVATPDADLRPDTYVTAVFKVPLGDHLALPRGAVLDAGAHRLVFVVSDDGRFEPREVRLGRAANGYYEVLDGVTAGEQVVTSANFLIDSESRLKAAVTAFGTAHAH